MRPLLMVPLLMAVNRKQAVEPVIRRSLVPHLTGRWSRNFFNRLFRCFTINESWWAVCCLDVSRQRPRTLIQRIVRRLLVTALGSRMKLPKCLMSNCFLIELTFSRISTRSSWLPASLSQLNWRPSRLTQSNCPDRIVSTSRECVRFCYRIFQLI